MLEMHRYNQLRKNNYQPRILYLIELPFNIEAEMKDISGLQRLGEIATIRH